MNTKKKRESSAQHEPRLAAEILLNDILFDNKHPLGISYRHRKMFEEIFPHTEDTTLKLLMQTPGRPPVGSMLDGTLFHDADDHFLFAEKVVEKKVKTVQRNPVIFAGGCVNVHLLADGTKRLEFNRPHFYSDFTFRDFCVAAAQELLTIANLLEGKGSGELPR